MKATDLVDIVFVTIQNYIYVSRRTRQQASDDIRIWWSARNRVMDNHPDKEKDEQWLRFGTIAINVPVDGMAERDGGTAAIVAVAMEHVIGMYVKEIGPDTAAVVHAKAAEKIAALMEKEAKERSCGDDWKKGDEHDS